MPSSRPRIRCLGVGPGWPCAERNGSSFLYDWNGARWLCDCGEPTAHRLKAAGIPLESIDQVFISHLHFDHIGGLFMFLQGCWVEHRTRPLTIRLPGHGIPAIREMLRQGFIFPALLPFPIDWRAWEDEPSVNLAGVGVTVHPTTHLARLLRDYPAEMPTGAAAYGFAFEAHSIRVAHSGDLGEAADLLPLLAGPVDLLVCELAHFPPDDLLGLLRQASVRRLLLVHLSHECWANREAILKATRERLPGTRVEVPDEGFETDF
ncbi:MAG: MBL fold metallo-hydrolase [Verrucomicrobiales bacterium]|nr:MBL fold metallo-hydrolase [Verrucomicrobiales bacterium]